MEEELHYFIGQAKSPYHCSVGVVLMNGKGEVCAHHYISADGEKYAYSLMRETMRPGESPEAAIARGLMKEFGATAEVERYLGSLTSHFTNWEGADIEKTTLYFLCRSEAIPMKKTVDEHHFDWVAEELVEWMPIRELIEKMKRQKKLVTRSDFEEAEILERAV